MPYKQTSVSSKYSINDRYSADVIIKNNGERYVNIKSDVLSLSIEYTITDGDSCNKAIADLHEKMSDLKMLVDLIQEVSIFKQ